MQSSLDKLEAVLETKIVTLVDAIDKADPVTPRYKELCLNLDVTMAIHTNLETRRFQTQMAGMQMEAPLDIPMDDMVSEEQVEILKEEE